MRRALMDCLRRRSVGRIERRAAADGLPLWAVAPAWYLEERRKRVCLEDILFAQTCLFLAIRIHDDLVDGQVDGAGGWLIPGGDDLLIEAQIQFARHVDDSEFWSMFRQALRSTMHGKAEVDRFQTERAGMPASARRLYAQVAQVLSLGVAAAMAKTRRLSEYAAFQNFFGDLAVASQLLDDLEDIEEDAVRGRLNTAATIIIGSRRMASRCRQARVRRRVLNRKFIVEGRAMAVIDLARKHAERASRTARSIGLLQGAEHADRLADHCTALGEAANRLAVDVIFGGLRAV